MEVVEIIQYDKKRKKVKFSNGIDLLLYYGELKRYDINIGHLEDSVFDAIMIEVIIPRAKKRAMHLIEKQDRSRKNISDKLREGLYPSDAIEAAIDYLEPYGYIDEYRMAENYIRYYQTSRSKSRIIKDLRNKGIVDSVIEASIEANYEVDEASLIEDLLSKKRYNPKEASYEDKAKMYRFLAYRGFSIDSINRALRS